MKSDEMVEDGTAERNPEADAEERNYVATHLEINLL
jgi:hypothetical protein